MNLDWIYYMRYAAIGIIIGTIAGNLQNALYAFSDGDIKPILLNFICIPLLGFTIWYLITH